MSQNKKTQEEAEFIQEEILSLIKKGVNTREKIESKLKCSGLPSRLGRMVIRGLITGSPSNIRDKNHNLIIVYSIGSRPEFIKKQEQVANGARLVSLTNEKHILSTTPKGYIRNSMQSSFSMV